MNYKISNVLARHARYESELSEKSEQKCGPRGFKLFKRGSENPIVKSVQCGFNKKKQKQKQTKQLTRRGSTPF